MKFNRIMRVAFMLGLKSLHLDSPDYYERERLGIALGWLTNYETFREIRRAETDRFAYLYNELGLPEENYKEIFESVFRREFDSVDWLKESGLK